MILYSGIPCSEPVDENDNHYKSTVGDTEERTHRWEQSLLRDLLLSPRVSSVLPSTVFESLPYLCMLAHHLLEATVEMFFPQTLSFFPFLNSND